MFIVCKKSENSCRARVVKDAREGDQIAKCSVVVRVQGVEPWSQPWEGYIIAVIRHPQARGIIAACRLGCLIEVDLVK